MLLGRAIAHCDRIAFLGNVIHGGRSTLALQIFNAAQPVGCTNSVGVGGAVPVAGD